MMQFSKQEFLDFALDRGALAFGSYRLKSGRTSPYFFNTGVFHTGDDLYQLGCFYAAMVNASGIRCDQVFGPAYKGIPLACAVAMALSREFNWRGSFCCDRKEEKTHGDGGLFLGAPPAGKVLLVDDVLTAGTSLRRSVAMLRQAGATPVAALVALNRCEPSSLCLPIQPGQRHTTAAEDVKDMGLDFMSLVDLHDVSQWLARDPARAAESTAMQTHMAALEKAAHVV